MAQARALWQGILERMFQVDWPFQSRRRTGPDETTRRALEALWKEPQLARLPQRPGTPAADWESLAADIARVATAEAERDSGLRRWDDDEETLGRQPWRTLVLHAEELAVEEPIAASIAAVYAMAAWEGALGRDFQAQSWAGGHHWGWHVFPLALARTLLAADAVWTARSTCEMATEFIEKSKGYPFDEALTAAVATYTEVTTNVERRLTRCMADLAWDLRASLSPEPPNFRAEVAAMLWTLGSVVQAERLAADDGYVPPPTVIRDVVERSILGVERDPFIQYLWLELRDRPPFDLREHRVLFGAINHVYSGTAVHAMSAGPGSSPGRAYARTAIEQFGGGVSAEEADYFLAAREMFWAMIGPREPVAALRMEALANLAFAADREARQARWGELAGRAAEIITHATRSGVFESFDNRLDIPFFYLDAGSTGASAAALDAVEKYRCGALAYWLAVTPPTAPVNGLLEDS